MKTYKQLQESIIKALQSFGSKGIRPTKPLEDVATRANTQARSDRLKLKYTGQTDKYPQSANPAGSAKAMKDITMGTPSKMGALDKILADPKLSGAAKSTKIDATAQAAQKYIDRRKQDIPLYKKPDDRGKGMKAKKRALDIQLKKDI
tara:strand:+ start:41 stop:484 length:444 start_codon:yes stop_codon:yes gene_type:complete